MYRRPSGSLGFSFRQFANNAEPSFMKSSSSDPEPLSADEKDIFYMHQIHGQDPYALDERSLFVSKVLTNEGISKQAFEKLKKNGVLTKTGMVNTMQIGPKFTHQMAIISVIRQKELIDLLFWWEEECHRMRKLRGEKTELEAMIAEQKEDVSAEDSGDGSKEHLDQLSLLLERVKMKLMQRPSERRADVERDEDEIIENYRNGVQQTAVVSDKVLPGYDRR